MTFTDNDFLDGLPAGDDYVPGIDDAWPEFRNGAGEMSSIPVYTVEATGVTLTVIRVDRGAGKRESYQIYAVGDADWALVGLFGLYVDALVELRVWKRDTAMGYTLAQWHADHPHGVQGK